MSSLEMTALPRENREHDVSAEGYYPADEMFVVLLCTLYRQLELGGNGLRSEQAAGRAHTETHHERKGRDDACPLARPARGLGLGSE